MKRFNQGEILLEHEIDGIKLFVVFEAYGDLQSGLEFHDLCKINVWFGFPVWHRLFDNDSIIIDANNFYTFNLSSMKDRNPHGENDGRRYHVALFLHGEASEIDAFYENCLTYLKAFASESQ